MLEVNWKGLSGGFSQLLKHLYRGAVISGLNGQRHGLFQLLVELEFHKRLIRIEKLTIFWSVPKFIKDLTITCGLMDL